MKSLFSCIAFFAILTGAHAQGAITLLTFESFTFADKFETEYGYGKIQDGFQWGAGLEFEVQPGAAVELIYQRMDMMA
jgi:opacity protein-like surface antigen